MKKALPLQNKGYALILVIVLTTVVVTSTTALIFTLNTELRLNQGALAREKANYLAQAGVEHGLMLLENAPAPATPVRPEGPILVSTQAGEIYEYEILTLIPEVPPIPPTPPSPGNPEGTPGSPAIPGSLEVKGRIRSAGAAPGAGIPPAQEVTITATIQNGQVLSIRQQ